MTYLSGKATAACGAAEMLDAPFIVDVKVDIKETRGRI